MTRRGLRPVPDVPLRAVAYVRVSKERDDMVSPELQVQAITDHCARRGYVLVETLTDLDLTGRFWRRRQVERAVQMIEGGEADALVVWKISRVARNRLDWNVAVDRVESVGGVLESATEPLDSATSTGRFTRGMLAEMAAFESERIGEQWKEAQARRLRLGLPHTPTARFGYRYDRATGYAPDPDTAPVLVEMYRSYVAGTGTMPLVRSLNARLVPTLGGGPWTISTLLRVLDAGFGAGLLRVRGQHVRGAHEPVIDDRTWQAYRDRRVAQRLLPARVRNPRHVLTGMLRCGECGGAMSAYSKPARDGAPQILFRCTVWQASRSCRGTWIAAHRAEAAVLEWLRRLTSDLDEAAAAAVARRGVVTRARTDVARLHREVGRLDEALARLTIDLASGLVPAGAYRDARDELTARRGEVESAALRAKAETAGSTRPPATLARGLLRDWSRMDVSGRHAALRPLIRAIEVVRPEVRGRGATVRILTSWE